MTLIFLSEFIGTALLIILGDGAVANATMNKSGMKGAGSIQITIAWGLAVMIPVYIFAGSSGAHFNPALTLSLAALGSTPWEAVPTYVVAQFSGAFLGACIVYVLFKNHIDTHDDSSAKLGVFATRPSIPNAPLNFLSEFIGTFILVFAILGVTKAGNLAGGMANLYVFGIIASIGMSLGGLTGYAINPARDLAPRFAHWLLPIRGKGSSNWSYAWIPVLAPICGALSAALVFACIPWK